jgi:hypothetical protein
MALIKKSIKFLIFSIFFIYYLIVITNITHISKESSLPSTQQSTLIHTYSFNKHLTKTINLSSE